jgi:hypothetical protein
MRKRAAAMAVVASVVLGAGAIAYAQNQPPDPSTADEAARPEHRRRHHPCAPGPAIREHARAIHGELIVPGDAEGTWKTVEFDRGNVGAVSSTSITLHRPDGVDVTKTISEDTKFRGVSGPEEVEVGKPAIVRSEGDAATCVAQPTEGQEARIRERRENRPRRGNVDTSGSVDSGEAQVPAA